MLKNNQILTCLISKIPFRTQAILKIITISTLALAKLNKTHQNDLYEKQKFVQSHELFNFDFSKIESSIDKRSENSFLLVFKKNVSLLFAT